MSALWLETICLMSCQSAVPRDAEIRKGEKSVGKTIPFAEY